MTKRGRVRLTGAARNNVATPPEAVAPLLAVLKPHQHYVEPCAGDGQLCAILGAHGHICVDAYDSAPRGEGVREGDATKLVPQTISITNPPYERSRAEPILRAAIRWPNRSWWLIPHDWLANIWCGFFLPHVSRVAPVGRVSWIRDANGGPTGSGFENSSWVELSWSPSGLIAPRKKLGSAVLSPNAVDRI